MSTINSYFDRLTARTGEVYRFVYCIVVAQDEKEARHLAVKNVRYGIDWQNRDQVSCEAMRECGGPVPEGFVGYKHLRQRCIGCQQSLLSLTALIEHNRSLEAEQIGLWIEIDEL